MDSRIPVMKANRLKSGDTIRVIAPANTASNVKKEHLELGVKQFRQWGLNVEFSKHANNIHGHTAGTIEERLQDFHEAFEDSNVQGVIPIYGGYNSHQLFEYIDWNVVKKNPKVFCGFSDITALNNALYAKTSLLNFSGPSFVTFCQPDPFDYSMQCFKRMVMDGEENIPVKPSDRWADDKWYLKKIGEDREYLETPGWKTYREGKARGTIVGGNMSTLVLLMGTPYFPDLDGKILFLEDDFEDKPQHVDRYLTQLRQTGAFKRVKGIAFGRFERESKFSEKDSLEMILDDALKGTNFPVITGVDFGHTDPLITIPIGGTCRMDTAKKEIVFEGKQVE